MRSIISSKTVSEAKIKYQAYGEWIKKNGHQFKEKKKETKLKHGIEKIGAKHKDQKEPKNEDKDDDEEPAWTNGFGALPMSKNFIKQ